MSSPRISIGSGNIVVHVRIQEAWSSEFRLLRLRRRVAGPRRRALRPRCPDRSRFSEHVPSPIRVIRGKSSYQDRKRAGPGLAAKRRKRRKKEGAYELCLHWFKAGL